MSQLENTPSAAPCDNCGGTDWRRIPPPMVAVPTERCQTCGVSREIASAANVDGTKRAHGDWDGGNTTEGIDAQNEWLEKVAAEKRAAAYPAELVNGSEALPFCPTCGAATARDKAGFSQYGQYLSYRDFERVLLSLGLSRSDVEGAWPNV